MIFHRFLSFLHAGSGGGLILRLLVVISRLVVFPLSAAIQISKRIVFHPFWTVCLRNGSARGRCTLIDRRNVEPRETDSRDLFVSYRRQVVILVGLAPRLLRCVFFPRKLLKSFLDGRSYPKNHRNLQWKSRRTSKYNSRSCEWNWRFCLYILWSG